MTQQEAFLAAILEASDDDTPRLIYADWLDEHGDESLAYRIREGCRSPNISHGCWGDAATGLICNPTDGTGRICPGCQMLADEGVPLAFLGEGPVGHPRYKIMRGFVAEVATTSVLWLAHGPAIVRAAPIERVVLNDKWPNYREPSAQWTWFSSIYAHASHWIPPDLFEHLPDESWADKRCTLLHAHYHTEAAALEALSAAALRWARRPPLPGGGGRG